ncbi:MAG: hypothetical protein ABSC08_19845 [Bryobacteraceae bacterium]|jgi:hypothetical protein
MDVDDRYLPVLREVDLLIAEAASLNAAGPRFVIAHRYCRDGVCLPGEEIAFVALAYRSREFVLKISTAEKLLFECLARNCHFPQSATQLEAYVRTDAFFAMHGANALRSRLTRKISRAAIKVHVQRLRAALAIAFAEAGLNLDPVRVLREERATGPLGYRLRATFEWRHLVK